MKHLYIYCLIFSCFTILNALGQDWQFYNSDRVYFFQASNTDDYFTLRTKSLNLMGDTTIIHFVDNYIPCDTSFTDDGQPLFYAQNGSVLGDSLLIVGDSVRLDHFVHFFNNMELGDTLPFSYFDNTEITFTSISDSLVFDTEDSVKYYHISDGTQLIQSKNFGVLHYPKQHMDSLIHYTLVGIENLGGTQFDHHNTFFDFEVGDKFYYHNSYYSVFYEIWDSYYSQMTILNKNEVDGRYYYDCYIDGHFIVNYPNIFGGLAYDYPGENVPICRGCEGISNVAFNIVLDEANAFIFEVGQRYVVSPETGEIMQVVGHSNVRDTYTTFGSGEKVPYDSELFYGFYPYDSDEFYQIDLFDGNYEILYEKGLGMVSLKASNFESSHRRRLLGAVKSGDTLGVIDLGIKDYLSQNINLYPNPTTEWINFNEELSSVMVMDLTGKKVALFPELTDRISVSHLPAGIYMIEAVNKEGIRVFSRFVKE